MSSKQGFKSAVVMWDNPLKYIQGRPCAIARCGKPATCAVLSTVVKGACRTHADQAKGFGYDVVYHEAEAMRKNFDARDRYTEAEAHAALNEPTNAILHLLKNDDGTFSIMGHIVCEWCDYCQEQGDARGKPDIEPCTAKPNPYELQRA